MDLIVPLIVLSFAPTAEPSLTPRFYLCHFSNHYNNHTTFADTCYSRSYALVITLRIKFIQFRFTAQVPPLEHPVAHLPSFPVETSTSRNHVFFGLLIYFLLSLCIICSCFTINATLAYTYVSSFQSFCTTQI
jgi:hypothetical protein